MGNCESLLPCTNERADTPLEFFRPGTRDDSDFEKLEQENEVFDVLNLASVNKESVIEVKKYGDFDKFILRRSLSNAHDCENLNFSDLKGDNIKNEFRRSHTRILSLGRTSFLGRAKEKLRKQTQKFEESHSEESTFIFSTETLRKSEFNSIAYVHKHEGDEEPGPY